MKLRAEPDMAAYYAEHYDRLVYGRNLASRVLAHSHTLTEKPFTAADHFATVLEVGAGTGQHAPLVRHGFDRYIVTDMDQRLLDKARERVAGDPRFDLRVMDAARLDLPDDSVDRLIAAHVLEHLVHPHAVLAEWARVVKPGGVISLVLPCDPGMAWRLGRSLGPRRRATGAGLAYDYWMAREHVNAIFNLVTMVEYHFDSVKAEWWPLKVPLADLNLIYAATIRL